MEREGRVCIGIGNSTRFSLFALHESRSPLVRYADFSSGVVKAQFMWGCTELSSEKPGGWGYLPPQDVYIYAKYYICAYG